MECVEESPKAVWTASADEEFHASDVVSVAFAHGAHDAFFSFLPTILPLLIQSFSLNTTQAGLLSALSQIPNVLQPVIGYLADHKNLKFLVILAPTFSGILISLLGIAPNYSGAALLLLLAGFSTAAFHAIGPGMVGARSGKQVGRGMGFFMTGGELGYGIGPLVVVAVISALTLRGLPWLMLLGMLASFILYLRLKDISTVRQAQDSAASGIPVRAALRQMSRLLLPIMGINFITAFLLANLVNFLPTYLSGEGVSFSLAGISLTVVEIGGTAGVFLMGLFSDKLGQRNIALGGTLLSGVMAVGFLVTSGWIQILLLILSGLTGFVANPSFLAIMQGNFPAQRSLANGMYMSTNFIIRSIVVVIVGALADQFGLRAVFFGSAAAVVFALPLFIFLPER